MIILRIFFLSLRISSISAISALSLSTSSMRRRMYCLFMFLSFISATYSACISSIPKPIMRFGTTSSSFSVSRIIFIALSMSRSIFERASKRWSFSFFFCKSWYVLRCTHSSRNAVHSVRISRTPITFGVPAMRILKLHG